MRATLMTVLMFPALLFAPAPAGSEESPTEDETAAAPKSDEVEEFEIPPGFRAKKRGTLIVYCRKETAMGTRFPSARNATTRKR